MLFWRIFFMVLRWLWSNPSDIQYKTSRVKWKVLKNCEPIKETRYEIVQKWWHHVIAAILDFWLKQKVMLKHLGQWHLYGISSFINIGTHLTLLFESPVHHAYTLCNINIGTVTHGNECVHHYCSRRSSLNTILTIVYTKRTFCIIFNANSTTLENQ